MQKNKIGLYFIPYLKLNSKKLRTFKHESIKLLEGNLDNVGLENFFFIFDPKNPDNKTDDRWLGLNQNRKLPYIQGNSHVNLQTERKYLQSIHPPWIDTYNFDEHKQLYPQKTNNLIKKGAWNLDKHVAKEGMQIDNKYILKIADHY